MPAVHRAEAASVFLTACSWAEPCRERSPARWPDAIAKIRTRFKTNDREGEAPAEPLEFGSAGASPRDGEKFEKWEREVKLGFENCYAPPYSLIVKVHETKERNSGYIIVDFLSQFQVSTSLCLPSFVSVSESLAVLG